MRKACQAAAELVRAAQQHGFEAHIGVAHCPSWFTPVGCESMKVFLVLGVLFDRAHLLMALNEAYNTNILTDHEVKQQVLQEALFLVDVIHNRRLGVAFEPVFQLVPEAMDAQAGTD
eukprot:RCo015015